MHRSSWIFYVALSVTWSIALSASGQVEQKPDQEDSLQRITTPSINLMDGAFDVPIGDVISWMADIESQLAANTYEFGVECELSQMFNTQKLGTLPVVLALNYRYGYAPGGFERFVASNQSLLNNPSLGSDNGGEVLDLSKHFDYLRTPTGGRVSKLRSVFGVTREASRDIEADDVMSLIRMNRIFHPVRASTAGLGQISDGSAFKTSRHNVVRKVIKGTLRVGLYTHVLLQVGAEGHPLFHLITFLDKKPVQYEGSTKLDGEIRVYEITRSCWEEVADGFVVPTEIHAIRNRRSRSGELVGRIRWAVADKVTPGMFSMETLGLFPAVLSAKK